MELIRVDVSDEVLDDLHARSSRAGPMTPPTKGGNTPLRAMERFDLDYIEQPVARWDVAGVARLAAALDTPICADQCAYTTHDVLRLLAAGAADLVCIKVAKSGLSGAAAISTICESVGVHCTLGSMLPLGVGAAAFHHFALHARNVDVELGGVYGSAKDYFVDDLTIGRSDSGAIRANNLPGLGVELDEDKVRYYAVL